ncbi:MAG: hypothetical protein WC869_15460 [Phycisphaerae bacterium]|jgi:VIT1/CCC1 family predicted Fe2+/Mn2+ transporter
MNLRRRYYARSLTLAGGIMLALGGMLLFIKFLMIMAEAAGVALALTGMILLAVGLILGRREY